jgi:hypothetical protein
MQNNTEVQFGAINLITDKPYEILKKSTSDFDLDQIDYSRKRQARAHAVQTVLHFMNTQASKWYPEALSLENLVDLQSEEEVSFSVNQCSGIYK